MKHIQSQIIWIANHIQPHHLRMIWIFVQLSIFLIIGGAPLSTGDTGG